MPNGMFGRVYWLEHLDEKAIDEMIAALVEHPVVVDPTLMATMQTKFWGNDKRWLENPDLAYVPERVRKGWAAGSFVKEWMPAQFAEAQKAWPILLALVRKMNDRRVQMVIGTDTPTPWIVPGASVHDEMKLLAGIPPLTVLRMATSNAARALHQQNEFGSLRPHPPRRPPRPREEPSRRDHQHAHDRAGHSKRCNRLHESYGAVMTS